MEMPRPNPPESKGSSEAEIRQLVADADAFQSDVEQFTALLTQDVVIVNIAGIRVIGKDEFRRIMAQALQTRLANVRTRTEIEDIRFVRPDVAIVSCVKHVFDENQDTSVSPPSRGTLTFVVIDEGHGWRIAQAQTTSIQV
jgi:uncharacterized protein (TIGR02246 family)